VKVKNILSPKVATPTMRSLLIYVVTLGPSYALGRAVLIVEYVRAGMHIPSARPLTTRYAIGFAIAAFLWLLSAFLLLHIWYFLSMRKSYLRKLSQRSPIGCKDENRSQREC
jgi:hypothetical protein